MPIESCPQVTRGLARFVPPLLWMGLIALGSSSLLSGDRTRGWMLTPTDHFASWASHALLAGAHPALRKLGHLVEFGILAVLWHRALAASPHATTAAFVLSATYGGLDELWQGVHPSRTPALSDVAVDALGAWLALAAWTESASLRAATLRAAAWGTGLLAGLGLTLLTLDWALDREAWDLTAATIGLGLSAWGLARASRAWRRPP